ncbi:MAG: hypothetical protein U0802_05695 [Candidatus Binatia bacterium]
MAVLLHAAAADREGAIARGVEVFRTIGSPSFPFEEAEIRSLAALSYDRGFSPVGTARQLVAILASGDRTERLRGLRLPTLVIHGKDDPLVPSLPARPPAPSPAPPCSPSTAWATTCRARCGRGLIDAISDLASRADA